MKPAKIGILSILCATTLIVVTYNACSVRRQDSSLTSNLESNTNVPNNGSNTNNNNNNTNNPAPNFLVTTGLLKPTSLGKTTLPALNGRIMMVRNIVTAKTDVYVHASGLTASTKYDIHVHNQPCQLGGGAHYKIDPKVAAVIEENEVWPTLTTGADGSGTGFKSTNHMIRPEGQSIVIHSADGGRIACGDFIPQSSVIQKSGRWQTLPAGAALGLNVKGGAVIVRNAPSNHIVVRARVAGLGPNLNYTAHLHNMPCATGEGGAHYKLNASVTEVTASTANEIWMMFSTNASGAAEARVEGDHVARADAASIVIHDPVTPANRLACVDLNVDGGFLTTEIGIQKGYSVLGMGSIERLQNGTTQASVSVSGLLPNMSYVPHVHDRPCHVSMGGGHYKIDYSVAAAIESNEIWPKFSSDAQGSGVGISSVSHLARPEAQSIVLHDPTDAARVACMDIY